ncbi:uncharacterized protein LOC109821145, partial [Asparagus officinalis]|uniref:uncharacterized protein LOC109821145 n=1 Tax=Asparagus officinalis TaxID=4686 RepID=UPI00098E4D97
AAGGGGGWGGWGFSSFTVLSDLQKAAEEISKNAVEVAKNAAKSITEAAEEDASATDPTQTKRREQEEEEGSDGDERNNNDTLRNSALDRLEKASQDTLLGQGLKVIDDSVESFASGAWLALGSALKGGSSLVQKLEHSAANLADSIQHGALPTNATSLAPSIIETGKSFTTKGIEALERVSKETMELFISETGLGVEKKEGFGRQADEEQPEEISFDRCFYIYGGPEQLEELESLSSHHTLLFNRRKAKLLPEQKSFYDGKLKQIQKILDLGSEIEENGGNPDKGKDIETVDTVSGIEMKNLRDCSVKKAADISAGFAAVLGGFAINEIIQRTTGRLDMVHAEGVHRLSELCSFALSHLLMLGKSIISNANKLRSEETGDDILKVDWPEDSVSKAKIIRSKAQYMSADVELVAKSFVTGISEIIEAYEAAIQTASDSADGHQENNIKGKATMISNNLRADQSTALGKIQEALQYLAYVVISTSMPTV